MKKYKRLLFFSLGHSGIIAISILLFIVRGNTWDLIALVVNITIFITLIVSEIFTIKLEKITNIDTFAGEKNEGIGDKKRIHRVQKLGIIMMLSGILMLIAVGTIIASVILLFM